MSYNTYIIYVLTDVSMADVANEGHTGHDSDSDNSDELEDELEDESEELLVETEFEFNKYIDLFSIFLQFAGVKNNKIKEKNKEKYFENLVESFRGVIEQHKIVNNELLDSDADEEKIVNITSKKYGLLVDDNIVKVSQSVLSLLIHLQELEWTEIKWQILEI